LAGDGEADIRIGEFQEAIADLKAAQWRTFTDNFLPVALSSGYAAQLNWFDDERWRSSRILGDDAGRRHWRPQRLILDPEHYNYALFRYADQRQQLTGRCRHVGVARQRGPEIMASVAAHLPGALFSLYAYTLPLSERERGKRLEDTGYSLLPAFYDGLLEAMPAGTLLVDGYESAYAFKERRQFLEGYRRIRQDAVEHSAVPDRYRQHVKAGFGLWLDYRQKLEHFTPAEFRQGVSAALEVSDGYVWIYSHGPRFFPAANVDPSYIEGLAEARRGVGR
jgi:hypothetical protein